MRVLAWVTDISHDSTRMRAFRGEWRDPEAGSVNFRVYSEKWVDERDLEVLSADLYRYLLDHHILPTFGESDLDEITAPRVREWRAERLRTTGAKTATAKAYRLLKSIMETAVDDDLIKRNPCRIKGAGKEKAAERASPPWPRSTASPTTSVPAGASWSASAPTVPSGPKSWRASGDGTSTSKR